MKLKTFAIFIFTLIVLGACTADLNEVVDSTYPDGSNKVVKYYENEADTQILIKEVGYYPDGKKQYEGGIDKDKRHGKWTYWYKNGNVWSEGSFNHGLNDGLRTAYHENGKVYQVPCEGAAVNFFLLFHSKNCYNRHPNQRELRKMQR